MIVLLIIMACTGVLVLFWFLSQFGPKDVDYSVRTADVEISAGVIALRIQSIAVEAQFEEVLAMRQAEPQDMLLLKRSLELQRQYVDAMPGYNLEATQRLENLGRRYQDSSA